MGLFSRLFKKAGTGYEYKDDIREISVERAETQTSAYEKHLEAGEILDRPQVFNPDIPDLWHDIRESEKRHICKPYTMESLAKVEEKLGVRLPESYKMLMKKHNGGLVNRCRVKMPNPADRICITEIFGIGDDAMYSLCGRFGSRFLTEAYRHNSGIGVAICNTMLPGRGLVFLDYRKNGPFEEPCVTYSDSVSGTEIIIAKNFEQFVMGLSANIVA